MNNKNFRRDGASPGKELQSILRYLAPYRTKIIIGVTAVVITVLTAVAVVLGGPPREVDVQKAEMAPKDEVVSVAPGKGDENYKVEEGIIDTKQYEGTVLEESEDAGAEYLDDTLFLGDSNTVRFMMYGDETTGKAYTTLDNNIGVVSMGVGSILTLKCEEFEGVSGAVTMPDAVKIMQPLRIIITFGTNNLSGTSTDATKFIDTYKKGLAAIHEAYPYAALIVNSIPPLDAQRENTRLSQTQIDAWNKAICEMCTAEGYKFLNTAEVLKDPQTGWAKKDYTLGDGVHLSKNGVAAMFEYIRTHAYLNEDTRPKPLKKIPKPKGVEPGLISSDPIAVRGAKVTIEVTAGEGGSASAANKSVKASQSTSISASPDDEHTFVRWELISGIASIGDTGAQSTTLTIGSGNDANGVVVKAFFEAKEEKWGEWITDEEPTCTSTGRAHRESNWGNREEKNIDPRGHSNPTSSATEWSGSGEKQTRTVTQKCGVCGAVMGTKTEERANPNYTAPATPTPVPETPTPPPENPTPETPEPPPEAPPEQPPAEPAPEAPPEPAPEPEPEPAPEPAPEAAPAADNAES